MGDLQNYESGGSQGVGVDRAQQAQVRTGAATLSTWQRRKAASCSLGEGTVQHGLQGCKPWAAHLLKKPVSLLSWRGKGFYLLGLDWGMSFFFFFFFFRATLAA